MREVKAFKTQDGMLFENWDDANQHEQTENCRDTVTAWVDTYLTCLGGAHGLIAEAMLAHREKLLEALKGQA